MKTRVVGGAKVRCHIRLAVWVAVALSACSSRLDPALTDGGSDGAEPPNPCAPPDETDEDAGADCDSLEVFVKVQDEDRHFPLFADAVELVLPGCEDRVPCARSSASTFSCEVPSEAVQAHLSDGQDFNSGRLALLGRVAGEEYRRDVLLTGPDYPNAKCFARGTLAVPLPACVDLDAVAVQGRVLGVADDAGVRVHLWEPFDSDDEGILWYRGRNAMECETAGAAYRCPHIGFQTHYQLAVEVNTKVVAQRDVYVQTDGCTIEPSSYNLDPTICEVEVWFGAHANAQAPEDVAVTYQSIDGELAVECHRVEADQILFRCPLTLTGRHRGGNVTIETAAGGTLTKALLYYGAVTCPAVFPLPFATTRPAYGVPHVVLDDNDRKALGLGAN